MVGDDRLETRLKLLLKFKQTKLFSNLNGIQGFTWMYHRMLQEVEWAEVTSLLSDDRGLDTA